MCLLLALALITAPSPECDKTLGPYFRDLEELGRALRSYQHCLSDMRAGDACKVEFRRLEVAQRKMQLSKAQHLTACKPGGPRDP